MEGQELRTGADWEGVCHYHSSFIPGLHKEAARVLLKLAARPWGNWQWDGRRRLQGVWCSGWSQEVQDKRGARREERDVGN